MDTLDSNPKCLTPSEMKQLQSHLKKEGAIKLAHVINCLESENHLHRAPQSYCEFFYELSLNTPVCGLLAILLLHQNYKYYV